MFDPLDDLEMALDKLASSEAPLGVERLSRLVERAEFLKLRAIREYDRSCEWAADGFVSTTTAVRAKCRSSSSHAHKSVVLARQLEDLPEVAEAFAAGEITGEHAQVIARRYTPARAEMIAGIEAELVAFARIATPEETRKALKMMTDAFDHDGGAAHDDAEYKLNKVTLSELAGRGVLHGSFDPELLDLASTALDAEMEVLRKKDDARRTPQLRADAFASICRQYLASRGDTEARGRGQSHVSVVYDIRALDLSNPELAAQARAETAHGQHLSRNTLDRICCDAKVSRVIMDGPSQVLDVGRLTRNIPQPLWNALVARDKHCQGKGCNLPPSHCEAHHIWYWEDGGPTDLANLKLLCWFCHRDEHKHDAQARAG
jgi:hypothetical protein